MSDSPGGSPGETARTAPSAGHGHPAPDACSVGFDRADVSAYGTAARAGFFVALEQSGPWGRDAATQSHLPADLGARLSSACSDRGGRLSLLRRPGRHADEHHGGGHTAYLAWSGPDAWLLRATVEDPATLLSVDLDALARGDRDAVVASFPGAVPAEPVLLVCTNGRRDVCCAVRGRPVAVEAAAARPGRVWEASHTGGHRFAPTGVLLPHGATLARLDPLLATTVLDEADHGRLPAAALGPRHDRGRSSLAPDAMAAESHVRAEHAITDLAALVTEPVDEGAETVQGRYAVRHRDGRAWVVQVQRHEAGTLPESCAKLPVTVVQRVPRTVG
ncbi:MAG TPA: sucrase ferredoxin [Pedococcus sp.]|nr:sucrase ferredoxin [Pedococcus sp.]